MVELFQWLSEYGRERKAGFIVMACLIRHGSTVMYNLKSFKMSDCELSMTFFSVSGDI